MSYRNYLLRKFLNGYNRIRLKNREFSLIASNCNGGCICHDLGIPFRSPFVNLYLTAPDFVRFLEAPQDYLAQPLVFQQETEYPIARLKDVTIYFVHYRTQEEAKAAWERRTKRINWENLFVLMSDQDGCTQDVLRAFDALPYQNKVVFTHVPREDIHSAVYIPGFEENDAVGNCDAFTGNNGRKYFDAFDYVMWFNKGKRKCRKSV